MELARPLLVVSVLLALAPPASAAPGADSGGALAEPLRQGEGGGALAPERYGSSAVSGSTAAGGATVAAEAAATNEEEPPRWRAEQQEREWAPYPGVAERPDGEVVAGAAEVRTTGGAEAAAVKAEPAAAKTADGGSLASTGLEIAALAAIGLGVLTLGVALRPRRREHTRALR